MTCRFFRVSCSPSPSVPLLLSLWPLTVAHLSTFWSSAKPKLVTGWGAASLLAGDVQDVFNLFPASVAKTWQISIPWWSKKRVRAAENKIKRVYSGTWNSPRRRPVGGTHQSPIAEHKTQLSLPPGLAQLGVEVSEGSARVNAAPSPRLQETPLRVTGASRGKRERPLTRRPVVARGFTGSCAHTAVPSHYLCSAQDCAPA